MTTKSGYEVWEEIALERNARGDTSGADRALKIANLSRSIQREAENRAHKEDES